MSMKPNIRREKDNEAKVVLKNLRISPQKLNLVLGMIRRQKADIAISKLQFSKKRISKIRSKSSSYFFSLFFELEIILFIS